VPLCVVVAISVATRSSSFSGHSAPSGCTFGNQSAVPSRCGPRVLEKLGLHVFPLLSAEECGDLVRAAETAGKRHGWQTERHKKYATTDLEVRAIPELWALIQPFLGKVTQRAEETLGDVLGSTDNVSLKFHDLFLVRYEADGQQGLDMHEDGSQVTFQVTLSMDTVDFTGGGTLFELPNCRVQPTVGVALVFPGHFRHAGLPITLGRRYVLVGFSRPATVSAEYSHPHLSFQYPYKISFTSSLGPCLDQDYDGIHLLVDVDWWGSPRDTFTIHVEDSPEGSTKTALVWIKRQPALISGSDTLVSNTRQLYLSLGDYSSALLEYLELNRLILLAVPPGSPLDSWTLGSCERTSKIVPQFLLQSHSA